MMKRGGFREQSSCIPVGIVVNDGVRLKYGGRKTVDVAEPSCNLCSALDVGRAAILSL